MRQNFHPVGVQLAAERRRAGLSQEALAARLGVTRQAVSNWEGGKSQPDLEMLKKIAAQLSIPIEYLIYGRPASRPVPERLQSPVGRLCRGLAAAVYVVGLVLGSAWAAEPFRPAPIPWASAFPWPRRCPAGQPPL